MEVYTFNLYYYLVLRDSTVPKINMDYGQVMHFNIKGPSGGIILYVKSALWETLMDCKINQF